MTVLTPIFKPTLQTALVIGTSFLLACGGGPTIPVLVTGLDKPEGPDVFWTSVSIGVGALSDFSCGVTSAGPAFCWGSWDSGQLGSEVSNAPAGIRSPLSVSGGVSFSSIAAGWKHACGLTEAGSAYCWGVIDSAQLMPPFVTTPQEVLGGLEFTALTSGNFVTCGLTADGSAYCWSAHGTSPTVVPGGLAFKSISAGGSGFVCGVTLAGAGYCWGTNDSFQLGTGTQVDVAEPTPVSGGLTFEMVSAGHRHACAIEVGGAVYCWGDVTVHLPSDQPIAGGSVPAPLGGGQLFATVSAAVDHTCGMTVGGAAYCWGSNTLGELGDGTGISSNYPVAVSSAQPFVTVAAGGSNACATTSAGRAYCWGLNSVGQLGDGSAPAASPIEDFSRTPLRVRNPPA
jgi:alpha-tubulin suppressor-like RCC1 family protein